MADRPLDLFKKCVEDFGISFNEICSNPSERMLGELLSASEVLCSSLASLMASGSEEDVESLAKVEAEVAAIYGVVSSAKERESKKGWSPNRIGRVVGLANSSYMRLEKEVDLRRDSMGEGPAEDPSKPQKKATSKELKSLRKSLRTHRLEGRQRLDWMKEAGESDENIRSERKRIRSHSSFLREKIRSHESGGSEAGIPTGSTVGGPEKSEVSREFANSSLASGSVQPTGSVRSDMVDSGAGAGRAPASAEVSGVPISRDGIPINVSEDLESSSESQGIGELVKAISDLKTVFESGNVGLVGHDSVGESGGKGAASSVTWLQEKAEPFMEDVTDSLHEMVGGVRNGSVGVESKRERGLPGRMWDRVGSMSDGASDAAKASRGKGSGMFRTGMEAVRGGWKGLFGGGGGDKEEGAGLGTPDTSGSSSMKSLFKRHAKGVAEFFAWARPKFTKYALDVTDSLDSILGAVKLSKSGKSEKEDKGIFGTIWDGLKSIGGFFLGIPGKLLKGIGGLGGTLAGLGSTLVGTVVAGLGAAVVGAAIAAAIDKYFLKPRDDKADKEEMKRQAAMISAVNKGNKEAFSKAGLTDEQMKKLSLQQRELMAAGLKKIDSETYGEKARKKAEADTTQQNIVGKANWWAGNDRPDQGYSGEWLGKKLAYGAAYSIHKGISMIPYFGSPSEEDVEKTRKEGRQRKVDALTLQVSREIAAENKGMKAENEKKGVKPDYDEKGVPAVKEGEVYRGEYKESDHGADIDKLSSSESPEFSEEFSNAGSAMVGQASKGILNSAVEEFRRYDKPDASEHIKSFVEEKSKSAKERIRKNIDSLLSKSKVDKTVADKVRAAVVESGDKAIDLAATEASSVLAQNPTRESLDKVKEVGVGKVDESLKGVKSSVQEAITGVKTATTGESGGKDEGFMAGMGESITGVIGSFITGFKDLGDWIEKGFDGLIKGAGELFPSMKDQIDKSYNYIKGIGKEMLAGVGDILGSVFGGISDALGFGSETAVQGEVSGEEDGSGRSSFSVEGAEKSRLGRVDAAEVNMKHVEGRTTPFDTSIDDDAATRQEKREKRKEFLETEDRRKTRVAAASMIETPLENREGPFDTSLSDDAETRLSKRKALAPASERPVEVPRRVKEDEGLGGEVSRVYQAGSPLPTIPWFADSAGSEGVGFPTQGKNTAPSVKVSPEDSSAQAPPQASPPLTARFMGAPQPTTLPREVLRTGGVPSSAEKQPVQVSVSAPQSSGGSTGGSDKKSPGYIAMELMWAQALAR